ncbi:MAG: hypothetical protein ACI9ON_000836 [Limisphaerales bacterium]|jgi:uncharacterized protein YdiU (UPF0061 family)
MQTSLEFDNQFTQALPADPETGAARREISNAVYSRVEPTAVSAPYLVAHAPAVASLIGLQDADIASPEFLSAMSGSSLWPGMDPHATCYGGHQFGNWAGQLGDGRAINLGEVNIPSGHLMLQLKGAGETPYSRTADGLAVMRSSVREFLCSEAMYHLGVPTTRALSLVGTGESVVRDMLYDGHPQAEPGAVVCRISSSFVRFGHFQLLAARQEEALLKQFTDFVISREFPSLAAISGDKERYVALFNEVCDRTALLMVHWMRVGFVHGVMNTDNMSLIGETIDYGPYGWLEDFDPNWTPNTTDASQRRYRFGQQPAIGQWNLMQLANALLPLIGDSQPLEDALSNYASTYEQRWQDMMAAKIGLTEFPETLITNLLSLLTTIETDMTLFFRALAQIDLSKPDAWTGLKEAFYRDEEVSESYVQKLNDWLDEYQKELNRQAIENRQLTMNLTNPKYVLRNYLSQMVIDEVEQGDMTLLNRVMEALQNPYDEQPQFEDLAAKRPEWARSRVGCSMLSCSS